jgi:hypothetical protein
MGQTQQGLRHENAGPAAQRPGLFCVCNFPPQPVFFR